MNKTWEKELAKHEDGIIQSIPVDNAEAYLAGWNAAIEAAANLNNALTSTQKNNIRKLKK